MPIQIGQRNPVYPTWAAPYETYTYYCDSLSGDDANAGTFLRPWRTPAPWNALSHTPGMSLGLKRGGVYRVSSGNEVVKFNGSGSVNGNVLVGAYGYGPMPIIAGSDAVRANSASWTISGAIGEYNTPTSLTYAATNGGMWWTTAGGTPQYLTQGTAGALTVGQFKVTAGSLLSVNIGRQPTARDVFEVPQRYCVGNDGKSYGEVRDVAMRFSTSYGVQLANTTTLSNFTVRRCDIGFCAADGLNVFTYGTNILIEDSWFHDQPSGAGDAISFHSVAAGALRSSGTIRRCLFQRIAKNGISNSALGTFLIEDCGFDGANFVSYTDGVDGGAFTFKRCWFNNDIPSSSGAIYAMQLSGAATFGVYCVSLNKGFSDNGTFRGIAMFSGAIVTMRNVNVQGVYNIGLYATGAGTLDINYVNVFGATTARIGVSTGANDLAASAAYVDTASNGLALGAGSTSLGAGVLVAGVNDGATSYDIGHVVRR